MIEQESECLENTKYYCAANHFSRSRFGILVLPASVSSSISGSRFAECSLPVSLFPACLLACLPACQPACLPASVPASLVQDLQTARIQSDQARFNLVRRYSHLPRALSLLPGSPTLFTAYQLSIKPSFHSHPAPAQSMFRLSSAELPSAATVPLVHQSPP